MSNRRVSINDVQLKGDLLRDLSIQTLKILSGQDDATFYEYFQGLDLEDVKKVRQRRESLLERNRELAVSNTELEPRFEEAKSELRIKCAEAAELQEEYTKKFEELKAFQSRSDPTSLKKQLQDAAKQSEETSENLASDFIAGKSDLSLDDFKDEFLKLREQYWLRKVKAEKLDELLKNRQPMPAPRSPRTHPHHPPGPSTHPMRSLPTSTPYPPDTRGLPDPSASMPPGYSTSPGGMPVPSRLPPPGHPFTPSYAAYSPRGGPAGGSYPNRPPPIPGYPYNQHRY